MKDGEIWILFSCLYLTVWCFPSAVEAKPDYNRHGQADFLDQFRRHYSDSLRHPKYQWRGAENERGEGFPRHLNGPSSSGVHPPPTFQREGGWRSEGDLVDEGEIDALNRGGATREVEKPVAMAAVEEVFKVESRAQARQAATPLQQSRGDAVHSSFSDVDKSSGAYFIALVAGCSAATVCGVIAAGFCWYKFQKNAKAAAEAEYPAYGVTGPNKDHVSPSGGGDRKLAHSAQMYHYQHQKQQMIAMEKNNGERQVSTSDLDSEDENEEGDYTVYECPGLAPTGDMEVKNPLFQDDPTIPSSPPVLTKPNDGTRQESTGF